MAADLSKAKSGTVIPAAEVGRRKQQLAACEARIETGLKSFADIGAALTEIRDASLYRLKFGSFEEYCEERWELSRKRAYDTIAAAAVVSQICDKKLPDLPVPAIESHAAALVRVSEGRRAEVWVRVWEQTGGKPTAKAVAEAWEALKPPADPHKDLKAELAGKGPSSAGNSPPGPVTTRQQLRIDRRAAETAGKAEPVPGSVIGDDEETAADEETAVPDSAPEKPHACRFACRCGKTDTAFSENVGQLMAELEKAQPCGHGAAWHEQAEWLHAQMAAKGFAWDGRQFARPPASGPAPSACSRGGRHTVARQGDGSTRCGKCHQDLGTAVTSLCPGSPCPEASRPASPGRPGSPSAGTGRRSGRAWPASTSLAALIRRLPMWSRSPRRAPRARVPATCTGAAARMPPKSQT